jgi:Fe-S-cluster-containing dehydrogenase component
MARYTIAINVEKCTGCHSCFLACKDEFAGNNYLPISAAQPVTGDQWLRIEELEQGTGTKVKVDYMPVMCQHCEQAPCMDQSGAVYRRNDGVVIIDPVKAKGRKDIVASCPYGAISWNEEASLPQKCTLCAHMLDGGEKTTRCVECCPTGALVFGDMDDPDSEISALLAAKGGESYRPELSTKPSLKYVRLPKPFVAGEVLLSDRPNDCVKGVKLTLITQASDVVAQTTTDFLGDFEFRNLAKDADYVLRVEHPGYFSRELPVRISNSRNLGEIILSVK